MLSVKYNIQIYYNYTFYVLLSHKSWKFTKTYVSFSFNSGVYLGIYQIISLSVKKHRLAINWSPSLVVGFTTRWVWLAHFKFFVVLFIRLLLLLIILNLILFFSNSITFSTRIDADIPIKIQMLWESRRQVCLWYWTFRDFDISFVF